MNDAERREALERLICGDWSPDQGEGKDLMDRHPDLRARYEELLLLERRLMDGGREETEILRELEQRPQSVVEDHADRARATLEACWSQSPTLAPRPPAAAASDTPRPSVWLPRLLLAAAAVLAAWALWPAAPPPAPAPPRSDGGLLSGHRIEFVLPRPGPIDRIEHFEWRAVLDEDAGRYRVSIADEAGAPLFQLFVDQPRWTPTEGQRGQMGSRFLIQVEAWRDGESTPVLSGEAEYEVRRDR